MKKVEYCIYSKSLVHHHHSINFDFIMQVSEVNGDDVTCVIKNSATLAGSLYTLHVSQIHIDLPTLDNKDKEVIIRNLCA